MENNNSFSKTLSKRTLKLVSGIEKYRSQYAKSVSDPSEQIDELIRNAAFKSAGTSAGLALAPGAAGLVTILPELFLIFRIQGHLLKDIAALYGKEDQILSEMIAYCLFRDAESETFQFLLEEAGGRVLVRQITLSVLEDLIHRFLLRFQKQRKFRSIRAILPFVSSGLTAMIAYSQTKRVGKRAKELFKKEIVYSY